MLRFKNYLSEEVRPSAGVKDGSIDIENTAVRGQINATLANVTAQPAVTPYIVLHRISKALAYFHIIMPKRAYLEGDRGVEAIEVKQFGERMGMTNDGQFIHSVPSKYFLFISYRLASSMGADYSFVGDVASSVGGMFKVTAKLVDEVELQRLLSMAEISLAEDCDAEKQQLKAKYGAPKEPMKDIDDSTEGTESAADTSQRKKDKKLSASSLDETRMPASVIRHKQKLANMTPEEKEKKFAGKSKEELQSMARRHGYGKDSDVYSKHIKEEERPNAWGQYPKEAKETRKRLRQEKKAKAFLKAQKKVNEEQIDEASYEKLDKYVRNAHVSGTGAAARGEIAMHRGQKTRLHRANKTGEKREQGINLALDKMAGRALVPAKRKEKMEEEYGVFRKGGSIGEKPSTEPHKTFDNVTDAKLHAKGMNRQLSPGEKKYYRIKYHVKPLQKEETLDEKLTKAMSAGDVISDFIHSKDPKFKGKSKKMRQKMALGAYYGMHPEKSKLEEMASRIKKTTAHRKMAKGVNTQTRHAIGAKREDTKTILVTKKGDPRAAAGGGVQRIPKEKFDPSIHNRASE